MVAGVMNGNWIIPTIEKVTDNSGKWEITSLPTLEGGECYASNGGSSLYITSNCKQADLAKKFLAYTFGGGSYTDKGVYLRHMTMLLRMVVLSLHIHLQASQRFTTRVLSISTTSQFTLRSLRWVQMLR